MLLKSKSGQDIVAPVGIGANRGEVVALKNGKYMVVWTQLVDPVFDINGVSDDNASAILGRVMNKDGSPSGKVFQINQKTLGFQDDVDVTVLKNGNVVVAWTDGPGIGDFDIDARATILSKTGAVVVEEFELARKSADEQRTPQIDALPDGGFVAAWQDSQEGYGDRWFTRTFDKLGVAQGKERPLEVDGGEDASLIHLPNGANVLAGGMFNTDMIIWEGEDVTRPFSFNPDFQRLERYSITSATGDGHTGFESDAAYAGDNRIAVIHPNGVNMVVNFFEAGEDALNDVPKLLPYSVAAPSGPGGDHEVELWNFNDDNVSDFNSSSVPTFFRGAAELVELQDGNLLALWTVVSGGSTQLDASFTLFAQAMTGEGTPLGDRQEVATDLPPASAVAINWPFATQGKNGDIFLGWTTHTDRNGPNTIEITGGTYRINLPGKTTKTTNGDDDVYGSAKGDKLSGGPGSDLVYGFAGDDIIDFSQGADRSFGSAGDDVFVTDSMSDFNSTTGIEALIDGGGGTDLLDLRNVPVGLDIQQRDINLAGSFGGGEWRNFEQLVATDSADTVLVGTEFGPNALSKVWLLGGDDTLQMNPGTYKVDGGGGYDVATFLFDRASTDVTVEKKKKAWVVTYDDPNFEVNDITATLTKFEAIAFSDMTMDLGATKAMAVPDAQTFGGLPGKVGNAKNNKINGTNKDERFEGGGGNDQIKAGGGSDQLLGDAGKDKLFGENGADILIGGGGNDVLRGGNDNDVLEGGANNDKLFGDKGIDTLRGGDGNDTMDGGAGDGFGSGDTYYGSAGTDLMKAGPDQDTFRFSAGMEKERIEDFDPTRDFAIPGDTQDLIYFRFGDFGENIFTGAQFVDTYASVKKGNIVFDFPGKDELILEGLTDLEAIKDNISTFV